MKWTDAKDRQLLIFGLGRDISGNEYENIANSFPEQPTAKAIQERLTKLRVCTRQALKEYGIYDADAVAPAPASGAPVSGLRRTHSSAGHGPAASTPSQLPAKKNRPSSSSSSVSRLANPPPGTPSTRNSQLPQPPSQYPQPPQMSQQPGSFSQTSQAQMGVATWNSCMYPPPGMSSMQSYQQLPSQHMPSQHLTSQHLNSQQHMSSPRAPTAQMTVPPMGASFYQPFTQPAPHRSAGMYPSPAGVIGSGMSMGLSSAQYPFGQPQALPTWDPDQLNFGAPPNIPAQIPAGPAFHPAVPDVVEPAPEEEDDDPYDNPELAQSQRELAAKVVKREAVSKKYCPR